MMASTVAANVSTPPAPLSASPSRKHRCSRARAAAIASAYTYSFEVIERALLGGREWETCETRSQEHKRDMIQLVLRVFRQGEQKVMIDYLMPDVAGKLRHACDACGLLQRYETGEVAAADFIGRGGVLRLRIEKDRKGQYNDRNAVADYVPGSFRAPESA